MSARAIARFYIWMNALNDFAYFGFLVIQFWILEQILERLLLTSFSLQSSGFAIAIIASQMVWQILAEGPTGAYADVFGRAKAVAASFLCRAVAVAIVTATLLLVELGTPSGTSGLLLAALILAQIIMGTGEALLEGSIEAWLRDEMNAASPEKYEEFVEEALGTSAVVQNLAVLASTGAFLGFLRLRSIEGDIGNDATGLAILAMLPAVMFLVGGAVATIAASTESLNDRRDTRLNKREAIASLWQAIRNAAVALIAVEAPAVRRLALVLILPFPCWILLSWFFTAFISRKELGESSLLPPSLLFWLGLALGSARLAGALIAKRITSSGGGRDVQRVFEYAVAANIAFLFGGGTVLIANLWMSNSPSVLMGLLFLAAAAAAKGSEEVVKLAKNRLLAVLVADSSVRATILSFISTAQNTFGFVALTLAALLTILAKPGEQTLLMFWICGLFAFIGILLTTFARLARSN